MNVKNKDVLLRALDDKSRPLITVSNHRCNIDDPLLWCELNIDTNIAYFNVFSNILSGRVFQVHEPLALHSRRPQHLLYKSIVYEVSARYFCAHSLRRFSVFALGRCVPCVRGEGIFQRGVDECINALSRNQWVHVRFHNDQRANIANFMTAGFSGRQSDA